jgi:MSHA biogenesis protein MshL
MHTRIFKLDYLAVKRVGESLTTSKTGQISTSSDSSSSESSSATGGNSSVIQTGSSADYWDELKSSLETLIGTDEGRRVSINQQTGIVIVRAMPSEMRIVEEYLEQSEQTLHRQVVLEARIIEVTLNDGFQSGINWATLQQSGSSSIYGGQFGASSMLDSGYSELGGMSNVLDPTDTATVRGLVTSSMGGAFSMAVDNSDFSALIELLKTQGDVQVLSSPRVSTVNNQKAVIKVGDDEFFVTNIETDTNNTTTAGTTTVSVELDPFFSGVALDVIPQISEDGDIVLHVHPAVSEVREQTKTVATSVGTLSMPLAASNIRESDTVIRAANGQVVVIGGLMQTTSDDEQAGVPVLGDLPLIGGLFRHTRKSRKKSELVILLKPTVVDAHGRVWQKELKRSSGLIKEMGQAM